jgi:hypothetical protein
MPVQKVAGGYRWGKTGKVYKTKAAAERQGKAIYASGYSEGGSTPTPTNKKLYNSKVAQAKQKFDVWPSAYASAWVVKEYKKAGGKYSGTTKNKVT